MPDSESPPQDHGAPTWPSIRDLEASAGVVIPLSLLNILAERYREHAGEYVSEHIHEESGKPYNQCMFADTLSDIEEEVVDAIFNCMVYNLRAEMGAVWRRDLKAITDLVEVWLHIQRLKERA